MAGPRVPYLKQLAEIWMRLQPTQRLTIVVFSALVISSLGFLIFFMNRVEYEVLYRDLSAEDGQAIATKLKDEKRDYLVQGTSILVKAPKADVDKLRLEIAGSGLARSGRVGYEIFDKSQWGMTDFTEQVNLQRALEGELARTISSLSEISQARVHIVLSKDSLFEENKEEAKASVAVQLKKGVELSKSSIAGIKGLVAGAVPGLRSHNVSIVDDEGKLLSNSVGSGEEARAELESGIREGLEKEMVNKVVSILEPVVGKGNVHANSSIDLDFNSTEQTEESFNPTPQAILSQQKSEERVGTGATASGVPGTQSNAGTAQQQAAGTSPERMRQSEVTNYEISKLIRHTVQPKGSVRRVSVAVILDHKAAYKKEADGKVTTTYQPRTQAELDAYRELVLAAVGYDKERGDTVTLENVPFFNETRPEEDRPPVPWYVKWQVYLLPAIKYTSFLLLFALVYLILFRPIRKKVFQSLSAASPAIAGQTEHAEIASGAIPKAIHGAVHGAKEVAGGEAVAALPGAEEGSEREPEGPSLGDIDEQIERDFLKEAQVVDAGARKYVIMRKKLTEHAKREPELVSQLIRSWLRERE
jgi:flagellar M-ring protein FliF